ncbi:response regulator transcription factor [Sanguibacter antarcticus]|uniref:DNA-binding response OmpR family regulator n=1 Tax=Sanguibacter antarcticus TaxID=372484 RepID=A0A2A9E2D7_9MICO|nr:response regulator transcription factor [Sanguibacter antarcticus]PFG33003.1 DNA-binding response OmpR family regulator [Sanguibacter antarcticus]
MSSEGARVLLVEDDSQLCTMLEEVLADEGYTVDVANDGQRGLHLGLTRAYEVLVLDRGLPVIEGLDLLGRLRGRGVLTPALILSALGNPADRVAGLDAGAEDYMSKPFDVDELAARLRALRRRGAAGAGPEDEVVRVGSRVLDVVGRRVTSADGSVVNLSERECSLLSLLARRPRQVFSRGDILDRVFDGSDDEGAVDTYVYYLRRKLGRGIVATVRGLGYRLGNE